MGTTAQKLSYLQETKNQIKNKIEDLGKDITDETTFREYAGKLEEIYNDLPKISDTGTEIILTNTKKGRMTVEAKGNTIQETTEGTNLWGGFLENYSRSANGVSFTTYKDGSIYAKGTASGGSPSSVLVATAVSNGLTVTLPAGTYTVSSGGPDYKLQVYDSSANLIKDFAIGDVSKTFTLNSETTILVRVTIPSGISVDRLIKIMLNEGSIALPYEKYSGGKASPNPDYPQKVKVVTGNNLITITKNEQIIATKTLNLNNLELCKIGDYQDNIYKENGNWYKKELIKKIDNYNGEIITTDYFSTTGGLDIKATVYYILENSINVQITDMNLIEQLEEIDRILIQGGNITIQTESNENNAQLIVKASALG